MQNTFFSQILSRKCVVYLILALLLSECIAGCSLFNNKNTLSKEAVNSALLSENKPSKPNIGNVPPPPGGFSEQEVDSLGEFIADCQVSSPEKPVIPKQLPAAWPMITELMLASYNQLETAIVPNFSGEEEVIYQYLFLTPQKAKQSYKELGRSLCFERLDRVWTYVLNNGGALDKVQSFPKWVVCPITGLPYNIKGNIISCSSCSMNLHCPSRKVDNAPKEIYRQLVMGYFTNDRSHKLDRPIKNDPISGVKPGETVVDIGCGAGCYTRAMAENAGPTGKVIAQDIDASVLDFVKSYAEFLDIKNISTLKADKSNPNLPENSIDRIFIIDVFNLMIGDTLQNKKPVSNQVISYFKELKTSLKPDGKLVIIDFLPEGTRPHIPHDVAVSTVEKCGFKLIDSKTEDLNAPMYTLTFSKD